MSENEKVVKFNGIDLCTDSFGKPADPAVLLIMGAMASMIWWDDEFCRRLARRGRYVIRFDNRDVGRSIAYEPGKPQYTIDDMAEDAVGILDFYGIERAHLAGMSLGGMIAQLIALRYPERVETVSLMMSSIFGPDNPDLPPIDPKILAYHADGVAVNWSDEQSAASYMAGGWRLLSGSKHPFDAQRAYKLAAEEAKRANNLSSMFNHALLTGGDSYFGRIKQIQAPALIIHGTEDPVLPYEHGLALAQEIPGAVLLTLEGTGHEVHYADWDTIIDAIIQHTSLSNE